MYFPIVIGETKELPLYLTGIGCQENQDHIIRPEGYPDYQISYCLEGEGIFQVGATSYTIRPGSMFYFSPQVPHEYYATSEPWKVLWVVFDGKLTTKAFSELELGTSGAYELGEMAWFESHFRELNNSATSNYPAKELECSALLYQLITKLGRMIHYLPMPQSVHIEQRLSKVKEYMTKHLASQPTLEELSQVIGVSPFYLCRLFKKAHNTTPFQYLIKLRLQQAKQLLCQQHSLSIKQVGLDCGFNDASYFCSVFKEEEGMTPGDFRRIHG